MTLAAKSKVKVCGLGVTKNSIKNFCVFIPMLVPLGSLGELYGDINGEFIGDGDAMGLNVGVRGVPGETFSMFTFS